MTFPSEIREQIKFLRVSSAGKFDEMADTIERLLAVYEAADKYCNTNQGHELLNLVCALNSVQTRQEPEDDYCLHNWIQESGRNKCSYCGMWQFGPPSSADSSQDTRPYKERFPEQYCVNCSQWMCGGTACCDNPQAPADSRQKVRRLELKNGREHLTVTDEFQSNKYTWCPAGFVPLKITDPMATTLLWTYAGRRRELDKEFSRDLEEALLTVDTA